MSYPDIAQQTIGEPLANPWYTPGWTAQAPLYSVIPPNQFNIVGFPSSATYATVTGNYFDDDGNPISGFVTFYPSSALTLTSTVNAVTTITTIPQRFVGQNLWDLPGAYWGTGKMFLRNGNLMVNLLTTDQVTVGMVPATFFYHVKENWLGGNEYTIQIPSSKAGTTTDISTLIVGYGTGP